MTLPELLQISSQYWNTCTLHAAVKLEIFTCLDTPKTSDQIARIISADTRSLEMLLHALTAMELLQKDGDLFSTTQFSARYLCKTSEEYIGHIIMHHHHLVEGWSRLDQAVLSGGPVRSRLSHEPSEKERESFLLGMFNLASLVAPRIAEQIDLTGRRRLLDLGGGPGTYAIHFCKKHPELTVVIFDLPATRPFAEGTVQKFGLAERISFMAGDVTSDNLGENYDVVWISHLLHSEDPASSAAIVDRAAKVLKPGGIMLIQEFILDDTKNGPLFPALFSLNMLINTPTGQSYSYNEISSMMLAAGLRDIKRVAIELPNGAGIIAGTAS